MYTLKERENKSSEVSHFWEFSCLRPLVRRKQKVMLYLLDARADMGGEADDLL